MGAIFTKKRVDTVKYANTKWAESNRCRVKIDDKWTTGKIQKITQNGTIDTLRVYADELNSYAEEVANDDGKFPASLEMVGPVRVDFEEFKDLTPGTELLFLVGEEEHQGKVINKITTTHYDGYSVEYSADCAGFVWVEYHDYVLYEHKVNIQDVIKIFKTEEDASDLDHSSDDDQTETPEVTGQAIVSASVDIPMIKLSPPPKMLVKEDMPISVPEGQTVEVSVHPKKSVQTGEQCQIPASQPETPVEEENDEKTFKEAKNMYQRLINEQEKQKTSPVTQSGNNTTKTTHKIKKLVYFRNGQPLGKSRRLIERLMSA